MVFSPTFFRSLLTNQSGLKHPSNTNMLPFTGEMSENNQYLAANQRFNQIKR